MRWSILNEVTQKPEGRFSVFFLHEKAVERRKELL